MTEELNDETRKQLDDNRISVVKVSASWCLPCKMLKSRFKKWEKKFRVYNGKEIKYYEVDGDKCPKFKREFGIDRYPSTLFFIYGVLVFIQHGITSEKIHEKMIKKTLNIRYERENNG